MPAPDTNLLAIQLQRNFFVSNLDAIIKHSRSPLIKLVCYRSLTKYYSGFQAEKYQALTTSTAKAALSVIADNPEYEYNSEYFLTAYAGQYFVENGYEKAKKLHLEAISRIVSPESISLVVLYYNVANDLIALNDFAGAEVYFKRCILSNRGQNNDARFFIIAFSNMAKCQYQQGKYKEAYASADSAERYKEDTYSSSINNALFDAEARFDLSKKEQANRLLAKQRALYRQGIFFLALLISLATCLLVFLFRQQRSLKKHAWFRDQIFKIISHDLKSPILALEGLSKNASYLIRTGKMERLQLISEKIDHSVTETIHLLDNLLEWCVSRNANIGKQKDYFLLLPFAQEAIGPFNEIAAQKQVAITLEVPETLYVKANRNGLAVILRNLVDNSLKHAQGTSIEITATKSDDSVIINIIDNGVFLEPHVLKNLHDQLDINTSSSLLNAAGLGLRLVTFFVKNHNGKIEVQNLPLGGKSFTITLPQ